MHTHGPGSWQGPLSRGQGKWKPVVPAGAGGTSEEKPASARPPEDSPIRHDLVQRVQAEILAGTYDTPEKFAAALERLFRELKLP